VLVRVEVDVVSHVVVFVDGLKHFHKVEILQVRVKPFLRNAGGSRPADTGPAQRR
jgi:hypothetical protein